MPDAPCLVRPALEADLDAIAAMAGALIRLHHGFDPRRFFLPDRVEEGYRWWLGQESARREVILLVATRGEARVGYAYGRLEARDWNALLDAHAVLHDIFVDPSARRLGVGDALLRAFDAAARAQGAPRIVLHTASGNAAAQALFARHGFRPTMLEMTCELDADGHASPRDDA